MRRCYLLFELRSSQKFRSEKSWTSGVISNVYKSLHNSNSMALDYFIELLESEFVDGLMGHLFPVYSITQNMQDIYEKERNQDEVDEYQKFSDFYGRLSDEPCFKKIQANVDEVDKRSKEHSPHFEALKLYIHQIDTSIDSMGQFFEQGGNNSENFREKFRPFSGYLEIIRDAVEGIKCLNQIYANTVDTDKISKKLAEEEKYHRTPEVHD